MASVGPPVGVTAKTAKVCAALTPANCTLATPGRALSSADQDSRTPRSRPHPCGERTVTSRAPLVPSPKPDAVASYAVRAELPTGEVAPEGIPRRRLPAGIAARARKPTTARVTSHGCRVTRPAQPEASRVRCGPTARARARAVTTRSPAIPSRAGSTVREMATAAATVPAAVRAMVETNGMRTRSRPSRAMTTVVPAKSTADPAEAIASAAASWALRPSRRIKTRCRYRMKSA